jgi:hypothetical protein
LTPAEVPVRSRLLPALGFVLVGLLGRALIDKALAMRGGAELVAHWAQVGSLVDIVAGVSLAGIGVGLTGCVAGVAPSRQRRLLGEAVRLGLVLSGICLALAVALVLAGRLMLLPASQAGLQLPALGVGWLAVAPGLLVAWLLGRGRSGSATAVVAVALAAPLAALYFAAPGAELQVLLGTQAAFGLAVTVILLAGEGSWRDVPGRGHGLRPFIVAGIAIGILSPAAMALARLEIAASASWEIAGAVQALWRSSEWITAIAAGLLNAHFLPRLAATHDTVAFRAELCASARQVVLPALLALGLLWLLLPQVVALLYREGIEVGRLDSMGFFAGDALRMLSWVFLFGLFARGAGWAVTAGELLSLPLFAALLWLLPGPLSLAATGLAWLLAYAVYAGFNAWALWRLQEERR